MATTTLSVYMNLPVPVPTVDPGPQYAFDLNSCLSILDSHTHAPGQGQQITPAGINITTDLSFGGNNAINLRSTRYTAQGGALAAGSDVGCTYVTGVDLYYNDINGNQIRLTQNGGVAGTPGSIANLLFPASVTYVSGTQTFVFQSSTATAGNIDVGSVKIREVAPSANAITISSPIGLAANYTITLPSALPSSASYVTTDVSGNLNYSVTGPAKPFAGTSAVGIGQVASSFSSGSFSTGSQSFVTVTTDNGNPIQAQITVSGTRPVFVGLAPDGSTGVASTYICNGGVAGNAYSDLLFLRGNPNNSSSTGIARMETGAIQTVGAQFGINSPSAFSCIDVPGSGTWKYLVKVQAQTAGQTITLQNMKIIAFEM